jgi:hypothetical protein
MDRFSRKVNLDPTEIKGMTMRQKQECMAEIDKYREAAWKYSVCFCLLIMLFIMIYSLVSTMYTLRFHGLLESISGIVIIVPVFVFVPSFFAHFMNSKCIMWAFFAYVISGFAVIITSSLINAWVAPFAFAGAVFYVRLSRCCDMYAALSKEEGFPEFFEIQEGAAEAKAAIERKSGSEDDSLNFLTKAAILANEKSRDNTNNNDNENQ